MKAMRNEILRRRVKALTLLEVERAATSSRSLGNADGRLGVRGAE
jgi:hypothetical protein